MLQVFVCKFAMVSESLKFFSGFIVSRLWRGLIAEVFVFVLSRSMLWSIVFFQWNVCH